jgi:hypothetical protein
VIERDVDERLYRDVRRLAAVARDEFIVRPAVVERVILSTAVFVRLDREGD